MFKGSAVVMVAGLFVGPVMAGEYSFCILTNKVADGGKLQDYSDQQIENGLCMVTKEVMDAIVSDDSIKQDVCGQAAGHMMKEFKRRFPNRDSNSVVGKC